MSDVYTPTTEVIKDAVTYPRRRLGEPRDIDADAFDRWLDSVLDVAYDVGLVNGYKQAKYDYGLD